MLPTILIGITIFLGVMCIGIILRKYCNRRGYTTGSGSLTILNNIISTPWRPGVEVEDASVLKGTHIPVISQCARFELITLMLISTFCILNQTTI